MSRGHSGNWGRWSGRSCPSRGGRAGSFSQISSGGGGPWSTCLDLQGNRGRSHPYIEGNSSTAFVARLIPQYESHIRVTKETIRFVVNLTKEIPHNDHVTKQRTPKLSQHVSHQGTVTISSSQSRCMALGVWLFGV